ncbi:hypothetical protein BDZ91DRAFT_717986 [Kalaharituber pfeilii]|nr:hypothetical protein BDZ91DRAFT_717986 [Kalaharituber pfeilii]
MSYGEIESAVHAVPAGPQPAATPAVEASPPLLEALAARHKKELRDLNARITQKKKNATKKTRRGVLAECEALEQDLKERHARELREAPGVKEDGEYGERNEQEELLDKLVNGLSLESTEPTPEGAKFLPPQLPPNDPASRGSRKPNRAKARLARRAAEMEAMSASAALEASMQPDRRAAEIAAMRLRLAQLGLTEYEIAPDGHCLYSAFADQLEWVGVPLASEGGPNVEQKKYKLTREVCADFLSRHRAEFEPFLDYDAGEDMDGHIRKVRNTAEWGGQMEVTALARAYRVVANIVQADGGIVRMGEDESRNGDGGDEGKKKDVWLAYYRHSFGLGEHYNSLRAKR